MSTTPKKSPDRSPIDVEFRRAPRDDEFAEAVELVRRSGVVEPISVAVGEGNGRPGSVSVFGYLVACVLNTFTKKNQAGTYCAAAELVAMRPDQRRAISVGALPKKRAYKRVHDRETSIIEVLAEGFEWIDDDGVVTVCDMPWLMRALTEASIPEKLPVSRSRALDGTDWESYATVKFPHHAGIDPNDPVEYDGSPIPAVEEPPGAEVDSEPGDRIVAATGSATPVILQATTTTKSTGKKTKKQQNKPKIKVLAIGPDGRNVYTLDPDARAGYRSSTGSRKAGTFVGYEAHFITQARDVKWTNYVDKVTFGPAVPGFITGAALVPAGTHRSKSAIPEVLLQKEVSNLLLDAGYTHEHVLTWALPLRRAGIDVTYNLVTHQRGVGEAIDDAIVVDGNLYSDHLPEQFRRALPRPPMHCPADELTTYTQPYDARAAWRYSRHGRPDADGYFRMICPFHAGRLAIRDRWRAKRNRAALEVELPDGQSCCRGTKGFVADALLLAQEIPFGTTAWHLSYARRNIVENANARAKKQVLRLDRHYIHKFGLAKYRFFLAFAIVGLNHNIERAWRTNSARTAETQPPRQRRRKHTYEDVMPAPIVDDTHPSTGAAVDHDACDGNRDGPPPDAP